MAFCLLPTVNFFIYTFSADGYTGKGMQRVGASRAPETRNGVRPSVAWSNLSVWLVPLGRFTPVAAGLRERNGCGRLLESARPSRSCVDGMRRSLGKNAHGHRPARTLALLSEEEAQTPICPLVSKA